jgi:beta-glucosidase
VPSPPGAELTAAGYEYYPQALGQMIRLAARKTSKPIFVTESGIGTDDDARRIAWLDASVAQVEQCLGEGLDVRSYIYWSLLDNFEWRQGYGQRFGLASVDRNTFVRTPKPSSQHLARLIRGTCSLERSKPMSPTSLSLIDLVSRGARSGGVS